MTTSTSLDSLITDAYRRIFRPYQAQWALAFARHHFVAILGARQIGKDEITAAYAVMKALLEPGSHWNTFSASQHHSSEWLNDCRKWFWRIATAVRALGYSFADPVKDNVTTLAFDNGSVIHSRPSTQRAAVGMRGSVLFNEIGVIPHARELYEAVEPIVTGAIDNGKPARLILVSNASVRGTFWHEWWTGSMSQDFAKITTTWESAWRSTGKPDDWIAERKAARIRKLGANAFAQWYECKWRSSEECFLSPALLDAASYDPADVQLHKQWGQVIGYDVGRSVDPAAFSPVVVESDHRHWALHTRTLHNRPYAVQRSELEGLTQQRRTDLVVVDSTGMGDSVAEEVGIKLPVMVEPFQVTEPSKWGLFQGLKNALEVGRLRIPRGDTDLRMELEALEAQYKASGKVGIKLPKDGDGHGDRAFALALAEYGASGDSNWLSGWSSL